MSNEDIKCEAEVYHSSGNNSNQQDNVEYVNNKTLGYINKSKQTSYKKENNIDSKKELKRQRRGLANISLKVKNIVAKKRKMTFK